VSSKIDVSKCGWKTSEDPRFCADKGMIANRF
jgi:hypothetical protein